MGDVSEENASRLSVITYMGAANVIYGADCRRSPSKTVVTHEDFVILCGV